MPEISIQTLDGSAFDAMLTMPKGDHGSGLIVIPEMFSSADETRALGEHYAALGYVVISPNLFHRQGVKLSSATGAAEPDWEQTAKLYKTFNVEAGVRDLLATLGHFRQMPECGGKVGVVGYCLGSRMAFLLSSRSDVDCAVCYYGVGVDSYLDEVYDIRMPLMLHLGENDKLMPPSTLQRVVRSLSKNNVITTHLYSGAEHGFMRHNGTAYHAEHAQTADARTAAFLKEWLMN